MDEKEETKIERKKWVKKQDMKGKNEGKGEKINSSKGGKKFIYTRKD